MKTHVDQKERVFDFIGEIWVKCPRCGKCAIIRYRDPNQTSFFSERRLVCTACPHTTDWAGNGLAFPWNARPADPFFGHPLWLQKPCCGEILWAYNPSHLDLLKRYVSATRRSRVKDPEFGWCNSSMASRLPKWMQIAKNRAAIVKVMGHLEAEIQG